MECKEMVASLLAQLSAAKDRIAELTPVAGMDWRETMQRMLTHGGNRRLACDMRRGAGRPVAGE